MSISVNANKVTYKFKSKDEPTLVNTMFQFAEYLWNHGYGDHGTDESPIEFTDLTDQEKYDLCEEHIINVHLDVAKAQIKSGYNETAKDDAQVDIDANVDLEKD